MNKTMLPHTPERGFTLLIALIVSTIVMTIGLTVVSFVKHQLVLSGFTQQSELAFYAADAAFECAQYWDNQGRFDIGTSSTAVNCMGDTFSTGTAISGQTRDYTIEWTTDGGIDVCSGIAMTKTASGTSFTTELITSGYNMSCAAIGPDSEVVERAIIYTY